MNLTEYSLCQAIARRHARSDADAADLLHEALLVVEALAAQGVEIVVPVSPTPDGGLSADFLDPDGHVLSYYQAGDAPQ